MAVIKRYSNRKLYDTEAKRYITLEGVADLIRQGADVRITDHETGQDITALILAQTVFDLEKRLKGGLPGALLTSLIRTGGGTFNQLREVLSADDATARVDAEIERRVRRLVELGQLKPEQGERLIVQLLAAGQAQPAEAEKADRALVRALRGRTAASRSDVQALARRLDALSAELDELAEPQSAGKRRRARTARKRARHK